MTITFRTDEYYEAIGWGTHVGRNHLSIAQRAGLVRLPSSGGYWISDSAENLEELHQAILSLIASGITEYSG